MNIIGDVRNYFNTQELEDKIALDDQNPSELEGQGYSFSQRENVNNLLILFTEIYPRSFLIVARLIKCVSAGVFFILSPLSVLTKEKFSSPSLAGKLFYREIRYLAAEAFEMIGVVACSILLLPLDRRNSPRLINAQIWIEKAAEKISGERANMREIEKILAKRDALFKAWQLIKVDLEEDLTVKEEQAVEDVRVSTDSMHILNTRRISRNYAFALAEKNEANHKLSEFESLISDKIQSVAIPKKRSYLKILKSLLTVPLEDKLLESSSRVQSPLEAFRDIQLEIEKTIEELHKLHDPRGVVKTELIKLKKDFFSLKSQAFRATFFNYKGDKGIVGWFNLFYTHFIDAFEKRYEIECIYSYQNIEFLQEFDSEHFISELIDRIDQCQKVLRETELTWDASQSSPPTREKALRILDLPANATQSEIKKSYLRLCKKYHPDKDGREEVFMVIQVAYNLLNPRPEVDQIA